jgi:hypothetical protein
MLLLIYVRHIRRYAHDIPWVHRWASYCSGTWRS